MLTLTRQRAHRSFRTRMAVLLEPSLDRRSLCPSRGCVARRGRQARQRRLRLGYGRAARIMDELENRGIVGPGKGAEPRDILIDLDAGQPETPA